MNLDENNKMDTGNLGGQRSTGMKVPEGYLENFENSMLAKIKEEDSTQNLYSIPRKTRGIKIFSFLAVAAALIWAAFWVLTPENKEQIPTLAETEISVDDIEYYTDTDEYLLAENISITELENMDLTDDKVTSEEIYEYIINDGITEFTITENF